MAERAWLRYRQGQLTVLLVGSIYIALSFNLSELDAFLGVGFFTGDFLLRHAGSSCFAVAIFPTSTPVRAFSAAMVVGAASWRAIASYIEFGVGPALVWMLIVVLLISTWNYVLPPPVRPPTGGDID